MWKFRQEMGAFRPTPALLRVWWGEIADGASNYVKLLSMMVIW
jgi:hypothetical protein